MAGRNPITEAPSTRSRILDAALEAFAENGFYGTSIRDISDRCGTRQPTIYHFFKSKENLYWVVLRSTRLGTMRQLRRRVDRNGDLRAEIVSCFRAIQESFAADPTPIRFIFRLVYTAPSDFSSRFEVKHAGDFRGLIQSAFRRHGPVAGEALKSQLITHLLQAMLLRMSTPGTEPPPLTEYEAMIDAVLELDAGQR